MPRPPTKNAVQVSIRVPPEWLQRADAIAAKMMLPGLEMSRADVIRMALAQGLDLVEREVKKPSSK